MKKYGFLLLTIVSIISTPICAGIEGDQGEEAETTHSLATSHFRMLPSETIINITEYLYGEDFNRFTLVCHSIREQLISYNQFFMPQEEKKVVETVQNTSLRKIPSLILKWSRTAKTKATPLLRTLLPQFKECQSEVETEELKALKKRLKNYTKVLNLLYGLGDMEAKKQFIQFYEQTQQDFHSTMEIIDLDHESIPDSAMHELYFKVFANLSPCVRGSLSKIYQQGTDTFKKDEDKSAKYSLPLNLPLSTKSVY